jgi:hypothetical protein
MVGRRWPDAGMSHVASNIHVAGGRNAFSQSSLSNMQIARLAYSKSMKKCEGVVQQRKLFGTKELSLGGPIGDVSPNRLGSLV